MNKRIELLNEIIISYEKNLDMHEREYRFYIKVKNLGPLKPKELIIQKLKEDIDTLKDIREEIEKSV